MASLVRFTAETLHLLGDLHGRWPRARRALEAAGVCDAGGAWSAGAAVLLQVGDVIDHGGSAPPQPLPVDDAARVVDPREPGRSVAVARLRPGGGTPPRWPGPLLESERRALRAAQESLRALRSLRALQAQAAAAGGRVITLLGNHDVDLLRGRFRYARREKAYLLALLGVPPRDAAEHLRAGIDLRGAAPELDWLGRLPILATDGDVLAVHGGPPRRLAEELLGDLGDLDALAARLDQARADGWGDPLFAEGSSLLSPDAREDDAVADPALVRPLLGLAGARLLALGHSPFLHLPKRAWVQADHPSTRPAIEAPARLGPGGHVLKLDTNLKRGGPAWVVTRAGDGLRATSEAGEVRALAPPAEPPAPALPPEGVGPNEHRHVTRALDDLDDPDRAARLRAATNLLLAHGAPDLAWVRAALRTGDVDALEANVAQLQAREAELTTSLRERLRSAATTVAFFPPPSALRVAGRTVHLGPAVARAARAGLPSPPAVITASYFGREGAPFVRFTRIDAGAPIERTHALPAWPPDPATLAALAQDLELASASHGASPTPPPPSPPRSPSDAPPPAPSPLEPSLRADAEVWAAAVGVGDPPRCCGAPGRVQAGPWTLQRAADGALLPLDTTLVDPRRALPVVIDGAAVGRHPDVLLERLDLRNELCAALSDELLALLQLGELEALGLDEGPLWRRGRFLFCGLTPEACAPFRAFKPHLVRFALAPGELAEAVAAGLLTVNLFAASGGEAVSPDGRWGGVDVAPEVVALDEPGIAWLWRRRVR